MADADKRRSISEFANGPKLDLEKFISFNFVAVCP